VVEFIGTALIALQVDLGRVFLWGDFYLYYSLVLDIFGVLGIIGLIMAAERHYLRKVERLTDTPDDGLALLILFIVFFTAFLSKACASALQNRSTSRLGGVVAGWVGDRQARRGGFTQETFLSWHRFWWWFHMVLIFGFLAYIPTRQAVSYDLGSSQYLLSDLKPKGCLSRFPTLKGGQLRGS
jgi:nitrate reductase gamma subunit